MADDIEARLRSLGLQLPPAPPAVANYVPFTMAGEWLIVSGQLSRAADGTLTVGKVGAELTTEEGAAAAALCALNILAQAKTALGHLGRIEQVLRLNGFVNAVAGFSDHPKVINGASDLMVAVLGDKGRHSRVAVGCSGLPANAAVEIDAIIRIRP
jgi:enamine deaminase RidA (YjgF/YER057c/UK114 family)